MNSPVERDGLRAAGPALALIVPAYNERARIGATLRSCVDHLLLQRYSWEIIVVDDGSTDGTAEYVRANFPGVRVLGYESNRGKGYAVKLGMQSTNAELSVIYDADGATPIDELDQVWREIRAGAEIVIGSRRTEGSRIVVGQPRKRIAMGRIYNLTLRALGLTAFRDTQCGFKAFSSRARRLVFPHQRIERFGFDVEVLLIAQQMDLKVKEVAVRWFDSSDSRVRPIWDSLVMLRDVILLRLHLGAGGAMGSRARASAERVSHDSKSADSV